MPWNESNRRDERVKFVARLLEGEKIAVVCREFGISRETGYKIFNGYKDFGLVGLQDRSSRPLRHANQLPFQAERAIVQLKQDHPSWGDPNTPASGSVPMLFDLKAAVNSQCAEGDLYLFELPLKPLQYFGDAWSSEEEPGIPCAYQDYPDLVDWSGRIARREKRGRIDEYEPAMLSRIDISADQWLINTTGFEAIHPTRFNRAATRFGSG